MVLKMEEQVEVKTLSKYAGLGAAITAELMIGFWFGAGVMLAVGIAGGLRARFTTYRCRKSLVL